MAAIDKLIFRNFKAFYGKETIDLNSKHLLMYGENGSGKSSIYWGLYTLLQSATKDDSSIKKYFDPTDSQNLLNYGWIDDATTTDPTTGTVTPPSLPDPNNHVEALLTDGKSLKINNTGIVNGKTELENFNRFSDFISHRLLINFYNYPNSKEINLWEVFYRDVFPFLLEDSGNGEKTLSQNVNNLLSGKPYSLNATKKEFKITKSTSWKKWYESVVKTLNDDIDYWIGELNRNISIFYNTHFRGTEKLKLTLDYPVKLEFTTSKVQVYEKDGIEYKRGTNLSEFNSPVISIKIEYESPDGSLTEIKKPQSHLNEAKLTSIALAVRFSLLSDNIRPQFDGQILVLDDLLVSLDMANRDKVLDIILKEFAPKYKVYLFTHERAFFNMIKERVYAEYDLNEWVIKEIYTPNKGDKKPIIRDAGSNLARAHFHFKEKDYPASINYLRKELEDILDVNLPVKVRKSENGEDLKTLDAQIKAGVEFLEYLGLNSLTLRRLSQYLKILLNPLSHNSNDTETYEVDINSIITALKMLKPFLEDVKKNTTELYPRKGLLYMTFKESDTIQLEFEIEIQKELYVHSNSGTKTFTDCLVKSKQSRTIENEKIGEWKKNEHYTNDNLDTFYKAVCDRKKKTPKDNYLKLFKKSDGNSLV